MQTDTNAYPEELFNKAARPMAGLTIILAIKNRQIS